MIIWISQLISTVPVSHSFHRMPPMHQCHLEKLISKLFSASQIPCDNRQNQCRNDRLNPEKCHSRCTVFQQFHNPAKKKDHQIYDCPVFQKLTPRTFSKTQDDHSCIEQEVNQNRPAKRLRNGQCNDQSSYG